MSLCRWCFILIRCHSHRREKIVGYNTRSNFHSRMQVKSDRSEGFIYLVASQLISADWIGFSQWFTCWSWSGSSTISWNTLGSAPTISSWSHSGFWCKTCSALRACCPPSSCGRWRRSRRGTRYLFFFSMNWKH